MLGIQEGALVFKVYSAPFSVCFQRMWLIKLEIWRRGGEKGEKLFPQCPSDVGGSEGVRRSGGGFPRGGGWTFLRDSLRSFLLLRYLFFLLVWRWNLLEKAWKWCLSTVRTSRTELRFGSAWFRAEEGVWAGGGGRGELWCPRDWRGGCLSEFWSKKGKTSDTHCPFLTRKPDFLQR